MKFINVLKQYNKALIRENAKLQRTYNELISESADGEDLQNETTEEFTDPTPNPLDEFEMLADDPDSLDEGYGRRRNIIDNDWSYANILRDNYDSIKNLTTKEDILNRVKQLFDENNVHTPKSYEMIVKLQRSPSLYNSINYVTNTILKSMGHGVIGEDDESDADQPVDTIEQNNDVASSDQTKDADKTSEPTDMETPPEENTEHASGEGESATIDDDGMQSLDEFFKDTDVPIDEDVSMLADEMMAEACAKKRKDLDEVELVPFKDFLKGTDDTTNADMNEMGNSDLDNMMAEGIANKDNVEDPDKIDEDELICASEFFKEVDTSSVTNSQQIDEEEITSMSDTLDLDNKLTEGDDDVMSADEFLNVPKAK